MNNLNTYTMGFQCKNCLHEFSANVLKGIAAEAYKGECPSCGIHNDNSFWFIPLKNKDIKVTINKNYSHVNLEQVALGLRDVIGGRVFIEVNTSPNIQFTVTCTGGGRLIPIVRHAFSWPELYITVEEIIEYHKRELNNVDTDNMPQNCTEFSLEAMNQISSDLSEATGQVVDIETKVTSACGLMLLSFCVTIRRDKDDVCFPFATEYHFSSWKELLEKIEQIKNNMKNRRNDNDRNIQNEI